MLGMNLYALKHEDDVSQSLYTLSSENYKPLEPYRLIARGLSPARARNFLSD